MAISYSRNRMDNQKQQQQQAGDGCAFCKRNRESVAMITSHKLKDSSGRVTCPMLRRYVCAGCGATGDNAHTRSYCPNVTSARQQRELQHRRQLQRPAHIELQVNLLDSPTSSHSSTLSPDESSEGQRQQQSNSTHFGAFQRPQEQHVHDIELGANRAFYNMSRVTNSRYNSAGWLRDRSRRHYNNNNNNNNFNKNLNNFNNNQTP